jgi:hypothetical protein
MLLPGEPHLLTIPREIRDNIYKYLHRELRICTALLESDHDPPIVSIMNAPYLSVLLVHSRLYEEYKECASFRSSTAEIRIKPYSNHYGLTNTNLSRQDQAALARMSCATICFDDWWKTDDHFSEHIEKTYMYLPQLRALRVFNQRLIGYFGDDTLPTQISYYEETTILAPLDQVQKLSLVQHATGRTVQPDGPPSYRHYIVEVAADLYTIALPEEHHWTKEEILTMLKPVAYPRKQRRRYKRENSHLLRFLPNKILGWKEERSG